MVIPNLGRQSWYIEIIVIIFFKMLETANKSIIIRNYIKIVKVYKSA